MASGGPNVETYDYIIVGGGSAGCVVVNRLIKAGKSTLLIEAGPSDNNPFIHIPATFVRVIGTSRSFMYESEPQPGANGRRLIVPQGRTLGGGSSLNAMIYIRGQAADYDSWEAMGCYGWSYEDVLPIFRRCEGNERFSNAFHGVDEPLKVSDPLYRHPLSSAFVRAAQEAGLPYNDDFNGATQDGVGFYQTTTFKGRRGSTASAYLKPVKSSPLLTMRTECTVTTIILENGSATGVCYRAKDGSSHEACAREEVVLSAGALATPKLLMLAGIGPASDLASKGIGVMRDLPGVGENFQDHLAASVYGITSQPLSLLGEDKGFKAIRNGLQYLFTRSGLLTSTVIETGCFLDTIRSGRPDIQINVTPALLMGEKRASMDKHGISINPCILRPNSRGKISLRSSDPDDPIIFDSGALMTNDDTQTLIRGIRAARSILSMPSFKALGFSEFLPGGDADASEDVLRDYVRQAVKTVYHPAGTCKMGLDTMAVVDSRLRVIGVPRLRVADASIMPTIISGNTNASSIMIGERCADFLLRAGSGPAARSFY